MSDVVEFFRRCDETFTTTLARQTKIRLNDVRLLRCDVQPTLGQWWTDGGMKHWRQSFALNKITAD